MIGVRGAARLGLIAALVCGCRDGTPDAHVARETRFRVPLPGASGTCWDLSTVSVCWGSRAGGTTRAVERKTPGFDSRSKMGWRCALDGNERVCWDRKNDAAGFRCEGQRCIQRVARVPDASEWTCADAGGASLCLSRGVAAGVRAAMVRPGFLCGPRQVQGAPSRIERVCLDLSPDYPDGRASGWNCHYEHDTGVTRVCLREPRPTLGDRCDAAHPACPVGAICVDGRCLPPKLEPSCWLDRDCRSNLCKFGSCVTG